MNDEESNLEEVTVKKILSLFSGWQSSEAENVISGTAYEVQKLATLPTSKALKELPEEAKKQKAQLTEKEKEILSLLLGWTVEDAIKVILKAYKKINKIAKLDPLILQDTPRITS